jgi:hypothetical protein
LTELNCLHRFQFGWDGPDDIIRTELLLSMEVQGFKYINYIYSLYIKSPRLPIISQEAQASQYAHFG